MNWLGETLDEIRYPPDEPGGRSVAILKLVAILAILAGAIILCWVGAHGLSGDLGLR